MNGNLFIRRDKSPSMLCKRLYMLTPTYLLRLAPLKLSQDNFILSTEYVPISSSGGILILRASMGLETGNATISQRICHYKEDIQTSKKAIFMYQKINHTRTYCLNTTSLLAQAKPKQVYRVPKYLSIVLRAFNESNEGSRLLVILRIDGICAKYIGAREYKTIALVIFSHARRRGLYSSVHTAASDKFWMGFQGTTCHSF